MLEHQLVFWFFSYSILIAGTAIAASALIGQKERRFVVILFIDISLLIMVFAVSFILFLIQKSSVPEREKSYYFLQLLFFYGIATTSYFILELPEAIFTGSKKRNRLSFLSISIPAGFLGYLVFFSIVYFIYPENTILLILTGVSQLLIFLFFTASSVTVLIRLFKRWQGVAVPVRIISLVLSILFVLSIFTVDIIYGLYSKIHFHRELNLFYILPFYSMIICAALTVFVLKNIDLGKGMGRTIDSDKLKKRGISQRELEVILGLIDGKSYKKIADELNISLATVQSHTRSIYRKIGINNKVELIHFCTS